MPKLCGSLRKAKYWKKKIKIVKIWQRRLVSIILTISKQFLLQQTAQWLLWFWARIVNRKTKWSRILSSKMIETRLLCQILTLSKQFLLQQTAQWLLWPKWARIMNKKTKWAKFFIRKMIKPSVLCQLVQYTRVLQTFICQKVQHFHADSEYLGKIKTNKKISDLFFNVFLCLRICKVLIHTILYQLM